MRTRYLILFIIILASCKPGRKVNTSFYYWKTVYKQNPVEGGYLRKLHAHKLYVRIMDVDMDDAGAGPTPVSPITFEQKLPDTVAMVPVVYIINNVLRAATKGNLDAMAAKIIHFVDGKVTQGGKSGYLELQLDCDWTAETRDSYFYLLNQLKAQLKGKTLSVTLRLHQIKKTQTCGIPPVNKALLMCYNMGNLRQYGQQNSIINVKELKKYLGDNLSRYPMKMDIGLPLFSWCVAFRDKQYIGIARHINLSNLNDKGKFTLEENNLYRAKTDLPAYGLLSGDEVRWEDSPIADLDAVAGYISPYLRNDNPDVVYFDLDEEVIKKYTYDELENVAALLR